MQPKHPSSRAACAPAVYGGKREMLPLWEASGVQLVLPVSHRAEPHAVTISRTGSGQYPLRSVDKLPTRTPKESSSLPMEEASTYVKDRLFLRKQLGAHLSTQKSFKNFPFEGPTALEPSLCKQACPRQLCKMNRAA